MSLLFSEYFVPSFFIAVLLCLVVCTQRTSYFFLSGWCFFLLCVGEKPTVLLYTYINRHAGTPKHIPQPKPTKNNVVLIVHKLDGI